MLTVLLSLGTSVSYGLSNFLGPQLSRRDGIFVVLLVSQLAALLGCAIYVVADGSAPLDAHATLMAVIAGIGNAGGLIGFYKAAQLGPLSIIAPIGATAAIIPVAWGITHGDELHVLQAVGVVAALLGCVLAARTKPVPEAERRYENERLSAIIAAISAVFFGIFLTAFPAAAEDGEAWALFDARVVLIVLVGIWSFGKLRGARPTAGRLGLMTLPGLLLLLGTLFYSAATERGELSLVAVLSTLFPVVTVGLGVAVNAERPSRVQIAGIGLAMAGVAFIAAA